MRPQIIVDCETTSLKPNYASRKGEIWELALIERDCGAERLYRMKPDVERADPEALKVGRFRERTKGMDYATAWGPGGDVWDLTETGELLWSDPGDLALHITALLQNATLIAANPTFDAGFLAAFLIHYGHQPTWHYRLRDIGSMAWAYLSACAALGTEGRDAAKGLPAMDAGTDDFARALGVDPDEAGRHTALGDCRLVDAMLRVMEGGHP